MFNVYRKPLDKAVKEQSGQKWLAQVVWIFLHSTGRFRRQEVVQICSSDELKIPVALTLSRC